MVDTILYCSDLEALRVMLEEDGYYDEESDTYTVNHTLTPIRYNENRTLSYVRDCTLDLDKYTMLENLGDYDVMFDDELAHEKYKSVYPYDVEKFYTDEDGTEVGYFMPEKIGVFA